MAKRKSWQQTQGLTTHTARRERIIRQYGGKCAGCGSITGLVLVPIDKTWAELAGHPMSGGYAKYKWVVDKAFPPGLELKCLACYQPGRNHMSDLIAKATAERRADERLQVIAGYGSECCYCPQTDPDKLEAVPELGCTWTGILGPHKPTQRNRRLIAAGFPAGIRIRCTGSDCLG